MNLDLIIFADRPWALIWTLIAGAALLAIVGFALVRRT